jgi:hypothetical protein
MGAREPTREQLELAFRQLRRPHAWPATLDDALRSRAHATCLRAMAQQLGRAAACAGASKPRTPPGAPPVPPTPQAAPSKPRTGKLAAAHDDSYL